MSGLCGFVNFSGAPASSEPLKRMATVAAYRGPDGIRFLVRKEAALCHLALHSTPEACADNQPLDDLSTDVLVLADLRLDNREELKAVLTTAGILRDACPSDSQILLGSYLRWGTNCTTHLLGDFAFIIWDRRQRLLFGARDQLGIKPLHYTRSGGTVVFASEARQVLQHPAVSRELDLTSLGKALLGETEDPDRTFFRDILRLAPAHQFTATPWRLETRRYWAADPGYRLSSGGDLVEYALVFREVFTQAVADRMKTQAPCAAVALSGGLDSGSVASVAKGLSGSGRPRLTGASLVFDQLFSCDERHFIEVLAKESCLEIDYIHAERHPSWPSEESSAGPLLTAWNQCFKEMLGRAASRGARVLLTGHGGDEVTAGSPKVYLDRLRRGEIAAVFEAFRLLRGQDRPRILYRCFVQPLLPAGMETFLRRIARKSQSTWTPEWVDARTLRRSAAGTGTPESLEPRFQESASQEIHDRITGVLDGGQALEWYDFHCAQSGLEPRHPFLDRRLVELILSLPPRCLFRLGTSKPLLREAMSGILPEALRSRPDKARLDGFVELTLKQGFVQQAFTKSIAGELGLLDTAKLRLAYSDFLAGRRNEAALALWYAFVVEIWLQKLFFSTANEPL